MKPFSKWSILFILLALGAFAINRTADEIMAPLVFAGLVCLMTGAVLSFISFVKRERSAVNVLSVVSFFAILFYLVWFEPYMLLYILIWMKNA